MLKLNRKHNNNNLMHTHMLYCNYICIQKDRVTKGVKRVKLAESLHLVAR